MSAAKKAADRAILEKGERTRETILDAAEELFGQGSFDSVSIRDIAERAGVLIGVIGYHFKSKETLFRAVATRRAAVTSDIRIAELQAHETPTVEEVVDAFIRPAIMFDQSPDWRNYMNIAAQISAEERWRDLNSDLFLDTAKVFVSALRRALPDAPSGAVERGFLYGISVLLGVHRGDSNALDELTDGNFDHRDADAIVQSILPFIAGGIRRLAHSEIPPLNDENGDAR